MSSDFPQELVVPLLAAATKAVGKTLAPFSASPLALGSVVHVSVRREILTDLYKALKSDLIGIERPTVDRPGE